MFNPGSGWFRRLERWISHNLCLSVFPHFPGMTLPYNRQLRRSLTLSEAEVAIPGLDPAFDGLKVLLATDIHAGPFASPQAIEDAFSRLLTVSPDLILLGGDFTSSCVDEFERTAAAFSCLRAPLGVYGVLGNHDHYTRNPALLRSLIADQGIQMLDNSSVEIRRGQGRLRLAGIDDLEMGCPDLDAALEGWSRQEPCVLLSHNPDVFFEAARRDIPLVLSGHTHGGQIRVPGLPVIVRQSRFRLDEGRYRFGRSQLVVSRGMGATGLPLRVHCSPEAVLLRFSRSQ
jgi:predicted MPP superfamily phosphohydrolase